MKLKVYQQGGGLIYTPFIPGATGTQTSSSSKSSGEDDSKLDPLDKEILALMKDNNLLPSDIQAIYNQLITFQKKTQRLSALGGTEAYRSVMPGMLQIQHMVALAKNNKENWDDSIKAMQQHDAGSEIALDSYGNMWVRDADDGGLKKIDPSKYDPEKYSPVSYSQLMFFRRSEPEMAFSTIPFEQLGQHIVGMKDARAEIEAVISKFGNIKRDSYEAGVINSLANEIAEKGYFKVTTDKTRSLEDLNHFARLVWENLGTNIQHLLTARAATSGYKDPVLFLKEMVFANSKDSVTTDFDTNMTKAASGVGASKDTEHLTEDNYLIQLGNLQLTLGQASIVPRASEVGDRNGLVFDVYKGGSPVDDKLGVLGSMSFADFRTKAWASKAGNMNAVTFGNRILDSSEYDKIMYDGTSEVNVAMLPWKHDAKTGKVMPDFDKLLGFNEVTKELAKNPNMSQTELMQLLKDNGINPNELDTENNQLVLVNTIPFITVSGYASDDTISLDNKTKRFLEHLDNATGKQVIDQYSNMIVYGKLNPAKSDKKVNKHVNTPERWDMYRGNIYIPMEDAAAAMLLSGKGQFIPKEQLNNYAKRVEIRKGEVATQQYLKQNDPNYDKMSQLAQFRN